MRINSTIIRFLLLVVSCVASSCGKLQTAEAQQPPLKTDELTINKIVVSHNDLQKMMFVNNASFFAEGWDTLAQPKFWKQIICLSPDSCIINIAASRTPLQVSGYKQWMVQTEEEKTYYKRYVCTTGKIDTNSTLYVTAGKKEFYEHRKTVPTISKAVKAFMDLGVDPWYAQTILLIESPGKTTQKSSAGAMGPFQLMKSVGLMYGLKINKKVDERSDLNRSAYAASKLLSTICIPKVKGMLNSRNISYNETDTWFRLLVLHAYHAGAGNLACAIDMLNPKVGGRQIILDLWKTECRGFKNESQNYSQIALASILTFEDILNKDKDTVYLVQGDRKYAQFSSATSTGMEAVNTLMECIHAYETDLSDGTIPVEYFMKKVTNVRNEVIAFNKIANPKNPNAAFFPGDANRHINLSKILLRKRKNDDALKVLQYNYENYPESAAAADSLSKAYQLKGNFSMAAKYASKSMLLK